MGAELEMDRQPRSQLSRRRPRDVSLIILTGVCHAHLRSHTRSHTVSQGVSPARGTGYWRSTGMMMKAHADESGD
jgi:hypothetical protein